MTGRHAAGYDAVYKQDLAEAHRRLKEAHPEEWSSYFLAARARRRTSPPPD